MLYIKQEVTDIDPFKANSHFLKNENKVKATTLLNVILMKILRIV